MKTSNRVTKAELQYRITGLENQLDRLKAELEVYKVQASSRLKEVERLEDQLKKLKNEKLAVATLLKNHTDGLRILNRMLDPNSEAMSSMLGPFGFYPATRDG